jgi:pimeloyl-ACP methyl ester carboxylesterase
MTGESDRTEVASFVENEPTTKTVEFEVAGQRLEGSIVIASKEGPFDILLLGGGGNIPYQEYYGAWQQHLATIGISSMSFDFRGVGVSDGELYQTSLDTRLDDARVAAELLKQEHPGRPLFIAGVSMGGPVATRLANEIAADGLLLVAPAAYSEEARHKKFGPDFKAAITKEESWMGSPDFTDLEKFPGRLVLAYGQEDNIIPTEILQHYTNIARIKGDVLTIPSVGHRFMREQDPVSLAARNEVQASLEMLATSD